MTLWKTALLLLILPLFAYAEEETLLSGPIEHGGYGGLTMKATPFDGEFGMLMGLEGGWIINHSLMLGLAGYGIVTEHKTEYAYSRIPFWEYDVHDVQVGISYGGLLLGYTFHSPKLVHPTVTLLIGGGSVSLYEGDGEDEMDNEIASDGFFTLEPTVHLEVNVVRFLRVDLGAGYRLVSGVEDFGYENQDIGGATGTLVFKFGKF